MFVYRLSNIESNGKEVTRRREWLYSSMKKALKAKEGIFLGDVKWKIIESPLKTCYELEGTYGGKTINGSIFIEKIEVF